MRAMYTVLIADDEAIVRMMLSSMIDWDEMELKLAACVSNGREALAYLEQHPVDILITDIQMPVIDGLELIRRVKEFHTQPEILVLSAYNDFPYVRQAFKLGIYDYCLKREIHEEMLKRHLSNMTQLLSRTGRAQTAGAEHVKDRKQLLSQLLCGELEPEAAGLPGGYYLVYFSIQRYQEIRKNFGRDFDKNFHVSLLNLAGQISQIANHGVIVPDHMTNLVMVYETGPRDSQDQALEGLLRVCRRLLNAWKNYMNVDASAAVSSLALGPSDFEEKLAEATMNLTMKYVMKSQNLFSSLDYSRFSPLEAMAREGEFQEVIQALKSNNTAGFESARSLLLARIQESPVRQAGLLALYLAYHIAASLVHQLEDTDYVYSTSLLEEISGLKSSQEVCIWTVNFLSDMKRYVQFHYQFDFPDEISRAINYIDSHYYKPDLTLYEVASEAGFSEKYFSTLFSRKMGMSFSSYMKHLRIHHAKTMLKETGMKLKEISEAVGYNSVEYFVRVFSAQEGVSPSAYRKQSRTIVQ